MALRIGLAFGCLAGLYGADWLSVAPNRLLPGRPEPALVVIGAAVHALAAAVLLGLAASAWRERSSRLRRPFAGVAAVLLLATALSGAVLLTGDAALVLTAGRPPATRIMLGAGFWVAMASLVLLLIEEVRATARPWTCAVVLAGMSLCLAAGARAGLFDALSVVAEGRARAGTLGFALLQHLALAAASLALAAAFGLPLGWWAARSRRLEAVADATLGAVQVTPALALFGLLIPLLAFALSQAPALRAWGLAAIGPTPAVLGVALYVALPLVRGVAGGLRAADPAVIEAARAMGMSEGRIARDIRIPLGWPILVEAIRVAVVQSIGLVTLGGLIGAGGLGAVVFDGMAQFAPDLILLGTIPIVLLGVGADGLLEGVRRRMAGRRV